MPRKIGTFTTFLVAVAFLGVSLQGCTTESNFAVPEGISTVTLTVNNLEPLSGGLNYQAWLVSGTTASFFGVPMAIFNIDDDGQMVDPVADTVLTGPFEVALIPEAILGMVISLELSDEPLAYSSFTFILSGSLDLEGTINLSTEEWLAFETSFSDADGEFILASPTDEDSENEMSGIWFKDPNTDPVTPGLGLPDAPGGWNYESWIVLDDQTLSMGKFVFPGAADSLSTFGGPLPGPAFPGEDFLTAAPAGLTFPTDLSGASVFVTIEPQAEWDSEPEVPFFLRILEAQVPDSASAQTLYPMVSRTHLLPTGTATVFTP